jgi:hypothetical protein
MPPRTYPVTRSASARSARDCALAAQRCGRRLGVEFAGHRYDGHGQPTVHLDHQGLEHLRGRYVKRRRYLRAVVRRVRGHVVRVQLVGHAQPAQQGRRRRSLSSHGCRPYARAATVAAGSFDV